MSNLEKWDALCSPPPGALKKIKAGRLKGMSDINPQWRLKVMTEVFGQVGFGWKYSIEKMWLEPGCNDQVCAFALVNVQTNKDGEWSAPVPGVGGSMLTTKESKGLYTSDEAYKMAVTDALSVALKALGVAGDVYMGMLDGSKYSKQSPDKTKEQKQQPKGPASNPQNVAMWVKWMSDNAKKGCTPDQLHKAFEDNVTGKKHVFSEEDYTELLDFKNDLAKEIQQKGNK